VHYYQHHIGDFIKATARLSDAQTIAYLRLIWMYYDTERPLPDDLEVMAMKVGSSVADVQLLLKAYFVRDDAGWRHTRCDKEIADYKSHIAKKSNAGKASAERRLNTRSTPVQQSSNDSVTVVELTNNHKPITKIIAKPESVSEEVWQEFVAHRKRKKGAISALVLKNLEKQANIAGWTLDQAMAEMVSRNWQGFDASWVAAKTPTAKPASSSDREKNWLFRKSV